MTRPRSATKLAYPAPVMGIDFRIPITDMPPQYSPFMMNFMIQGGKLRKRHSHTTAVESSVGSSDVAVMCIPPRILSSNKPIIINSNKTDDGSTSSSTPAGEISFDNHYIVYRDKLFVSGTTTVYTLHPTTLAWTSAFTYAGSNPSGNGGGGPLAAYRGRLYVARGFDLEYLAPGAISGTPTVFSVQDLMNASGIVAMGTLSTSFGVGPDQYLVLVGQQGEVLIYSGAYPGASDWALVSRMNIQAGGGTELISIPNDLLICPTSGPQMYSVRELIASGDGAAVYSKIKPIHPIFFELPPYASSYSTYLRKTTCYWPAKNSLVMPVQFFTTQGIETEDIPYFGAWADYIRDSFDPGANGSCSIIIFLIDMESGAVTMHDFMEYNLWGHIQASDNYILMPGADIAYRLFDDTTASYLDSGGVDYHSICCFAPNRALGYSTASVKNLVMYSNLVSGHTLQHGISKDFSVKPANFTTYTTSKTEKFTVTATVLPGSQQGIAFIPQIKESGHNPEPFELYGLDPIFEPGGMY